MIEWNGKRPLAVVTACMNSQGIPDFAFHEVEVTQEEFENGIHYLLVEEQLNRAGFEEPYLHFDEVESPSFLHPAVRQYLHMPPWVVHVHHRPAGENSDVPIHVTQEPPHHGPDDSLPTADVAHAHERHSRAR